MRFPITDGNKAELYVNLVLVINFTDRQVEKLSDLFMDLAKGLFLAAFAVPALTTGADFLFLLRTIISGIMCVYASLWLINPKGVRTWT